MKKKWLFWGIVIAVLIADRITKELAPGIPAEGITLIPGVIGLKAIHQTSAAEREKVPALRELSIDIGISSKEEAEKYVHVGDVACFVGPYTPLAGDFVTSKAVDDRIGCFLQLEVMKALQGKPVCNDLYFVFTVQEEVGCRGSIVSAERIAPDIGIAVDVTPDHGRPGDLEGSNECGGGTAIKISDTSVICDEDLVAMMIGIAEEQGIKYQRDVIYVGGTDASSMNMARYGARACAVSVCTRYTHGTNCIFNKKDAEGSVELLTRFVNLEFAG